MRQPERWRVVIAVTSAGAYTLLHGLLESLGHRVVGLLTTPGSPERSTDDLSSAVSAAGGDVDVVATVHREQWATLLAPLRPDLIICAGFPFRLPEDVLAVPRLGAINGHNSLLPAYRGPNPQGWVLRNGEPITGFTVHRMTSAFDAGAVLSQVRVELSDDDDITSLGAKLMPLLPGVFTAALERIARGELGEPQDPTAGSAAPFFDEAWRHVDWASPARMIHNQVRSLFEMPGQPAGALAALGGREIRILATRLPDNDRRASSALRPRLDSPAAGEVISDDGTEIVVQCADGPLHIISWVAA